MEGFKNGYQKCLRMKHRFFLDKLRKSSKKVRNKFKISGADIFGSFKLCLKYALGFYHFLANLNAFACKEVINSIMEIFGSLSIMERWLFDAFKMGTPGAPMRTSATSLLTLT